MEDYCMSALTCRKTYTDIPWAHRQHLHDGHCAFIHGHNWGLTIVFGCREPDENGFVVDFGKLKFLKGWIEEHLDHACVFSADDPILNQVNSLGGAAVWKTYIVPNCSCEGMAQHLYGIFNPMVQQASNGRAFVVSIEVIEDSKNAATFVAPVTDHNGSTFRQAAVSRFG
jgi:6-pyruvoyltetrahydropterin/6-carboxytetrahydropterin synthase